ncbi:DUF6415 family natural product biosynthesis protein [Streptomyces mirabilis]|uniref:DUF6415 family natural product biosynthesis protein n=1 Tax=Streptomyces mirabilis TaxID=68239 RepID=UPI0021BEC7C7|nr:DUF6415 family natural product biosynthesis protein [Streptomyces mirabilis]MCT9107937.1 DUF6415 family natural product biosynthesis protein [Streptomyces mirabilis]
MTGTVEAASDTLPPDIETMREAASRLLDPDAVPEALPPVGEELAALTLQIKGHLELIAPEVRQAATKLPKDSIPRYCALGCVGEARDRLRALPSPAPGGDVAYARRLARVLNALCDHFENLGCEHRGAGQ